MIWFFACIVFVESAMAQALNGPAELVERIRDQEERVPIAGTCGSLGRFDSLQRETSRALVSSGNQGLSELERVLGEIDVAGIASGYARSAKWLLNSYAALKGVNAYPTLRAMLHNPGNRFLHEPIVNAICLSLGLTGYVDKTSPPPPPRCRTEEPRDSLSSMIFAWQTNDATRLGEALGPTATAALDKLHLWPKRPPREIDSARGRDVGFMLDVPGGWSRPQGSLAELDLGGRNLLANPIAKIDARFTADSRASCGEVTVDFILVTTEHGQHYVVDNANIAAVVHLISQCATAEK